MHAKLVWIFQSANEISLKFSRVQLKSVWIFQSASEISLNFPECQTERAGDTCPAGPRWWGFWGPSSSGQASFSVSQKQFGAPKPLKKFLQTVTGPSTTVTVLLQYCYSISVQSPESIQIWNEKDDFSFDRKIVKTANAQFCCFECKK